MPNVFGDDWDVEQEQDRFRWKRMRVGLRLGAEKLGASVYELPPGERTFPYHLHHANEEILVVLEGTVSVRRQESEEELSRGDVACFPVGPEGGHQIVNSSSEPARILMVSTMIAPEIAEYPDSGKVALMAAPPGKGDQGLKLFLRRDAEVDYFEDEPGDLP